MAKIFFSGIGGSGMSSLAWFTAAHGNAVTGSDRTFDTHPQTKLRSMLVSNGIQIVPQNGLSIDSSFDLLVFSTAVEDDHPEKVRARELRIPIKSRPEFLRQVVTEYRSFAVAGTSGKSTIAGMIAFVMKRIGQNPNFIGGGRVKAFKTEKNPGNVLTGTSDMLVFEACESDGSIIHYQPAHTVIANISLDHQPAETTADMFRILAHHTRGKVILNGDDPRLGMWSSPGSVLFSIDAVSAYRASHIHYEPLKTCFRVNGVQFEVSLPGTHNLYNVLASLALLAEIGLNIKDIANILPDFTGLDRRFDVHLYTGDRLVIDDYAHNPHKITCLMETVKKFRARICFVFQPHGFAPTRLMRQGYVDAFSSGLRADDHLVLLPIYYAGGTPVQDISSENLCASIRQGGKSAEVFHERSQIIERINDWDTYVVFGARDETLADLAHEIASELSKSMRI